MRPHAFGLLPASVDGLRGSCPVLPLAAAPASAACAASTPLGGPAASPGFAASGAVPSFSWTRAPSALAISWNALCSTGVSAGRLSDGSGRAGRNGTTFLAGGTTVSCGRSDAGEDGEMRPGGTACATGLLAVDAFTVDATCTGGDVL